MRDEDSYSGAARSQARPAFLGYVGVTPDGVPYFTTDPAESNAVVVEVSGGNIAVDTVAASGLRLAAVGEVLSARTVP